MKIRVTIDEGPIHINEVLEANSDDELFRKFRERATSHAPFAIKLAIKTMSDQALLQQVVQRYNQKFKANEPAPSSAKEFIAFGERAGYIQRI